MSKLTKKLLVLLMTAVIVLTALTLVACEGLFGPADKPERLEIINSGGVVPEDVTDETIKMHIMVQHYDKKGNGNIVPERDFAVVEFNIVDDEVSVVVSYKNLTAFGYYYIHREIIKDHTHVEFVPNDQYNTSIPSQDLGMGECVREPNAPHWDGVTFLGWFTKEITQDGKTKWTKWDFSQPITLSGENHLFLYGRWEQLITINYYNDKDGEIHAVEQVNILDNDAVSSSPDEPTKTNYVFDGWRFVDDEDEREWIPDYVFWVGTENNTIDVYPKYLATFNVVFDTNGGEQVEPFVVKDGEAFSAPETATKDGYKFACWSMYDVRSTGIDHRVVFRDNYSIIETTEIEGNVFGLEAGATFTVYAEFYNEDEPTEGLYFEYYQDSNGIKDESKYVIYRNPSATEESAECSGFAVVIPSTYNGKPVVGIGCGTFLNNHNLTAVVLPDTITDIQYNAFGDCYNLRDITLPSAIKTIEQTAFVNCVNLDVVLPEGLICIGERAFSGTAFNGSLPSTLETIGAYAFGSTSYQDNGTPVTNVVLPAGLLYLGEGAFSRCKSLTSVTINSATCEIGANAFYGCSNLTDVTLAQGMESIPNGMFSSCSSLASIVLPSTVTHIGNSAFTYTGLTSLTLPSGLVTIGNSAFSHTQLASINLPSNLTSIGQSAFEYTYITQVAIPSNVTQISKSAFSNCSALTTVTLPQGLESIGENAFYYNSKLTSINIPDSVQNIADYAFAYCAALTSVNLANVQGVGERAFYNCSALTTVGTFNKIDTLGSYAFSGAKINFGALTLPNTLELIGRNAFGGCTITALYINSEPELLISAYAFDGIIGLQSASLQGNIKSLGSYAFYGCDQLASVSLTKNIQKISQNAFAKSSLATLAFNGNLSDWLKVELNDTVLADNGVTITFNGNELTGNVTLSPSAGESLTIGQYALQGLTNVTSFTLHNVKSVGECAFYGCTELTKVTFDGFATDVIGVQRNAFDNCDKLQYNEYGNGLYLGNNSNEHYVFVKLTDTDVIELNLHADTKMIANNALRYDEYPNLTTLTLPDGLQVIGEGAFYGCNLVTELVVPDSVARIGNGAFEGWDALQRLTIPFVGERNYFNTLNTKLNWIFGGDSKSNKYPSNLEYVEVTGGIIDQCAFENCTSLKELNAGKAARVLARALLGCTNVVKLTVPTSVTFTQATSELSDDEQRSFTGIHAYFVSGYDTKVTNTLDVTITGGGDLDSQTFVCGKPLSLSKVTLGLGVTKAYSTTLSYVTIGELYYEGTMAQWEQIAVGDWTKTSVTVVHCSDGDVDITA